MFDVVLQNLPAVIITLPMFVAVLIAILPRSENARWFAWFLSFVTSGFIMSCCVYLLVEVYFTGSVNYSFGGFSAPFGIQYLATSLNVFVLLVLSLVNFLIVPSAYALVEAEVEKEKIPLFYSAYMLCLSGLFGMVMTNDIFNIYVFLEISSLAAYAMIALSGTRESLKAAFNYLVVGTIGGTLFLMGIAFIYAHTGTLNISDIISFSVNKEPTKVTLAAYVFMLTGLLIKSAAFPLCNWLPRAYTHAPSYVSAFIAATATKVALFVIFRITYEIFSASSFSFALIFISVIGMLYGSIAACLQSNVKRILAFSSIANVSYILLGFAMFEASSVAASFYHYFAHALAKGGLFVITGVVVLHAGGSQLKHFHGMGKKLPVTMACFTILALSLVGLPLTPGFISKWYWISATTAYQSSALQVLLIGSIVASSLFSVYYIWRIIEAAYFKPAEKEFADHYFSTFSVITLTAVSVLLGLFSAPVIKYIEQIVRTVLSGGGYA